MVAFMFCTCLQIVTKNFFFLLLTELSKVAFYRRCYSMCTLYMDDLSIKLNQSGIGGDIGSHLINHLCCADDLCLISLSSAGMQKFLDMCSTYAIEHLLTYNGTKSCSLCFKPKHIKFI